MVKGPAPTTPLYLTTLLPSPEDRVDTVASEKATSEEDSAEGSQLDSQPQEATRLKFEEPTADGGHPASGWVGRPGDGQSSGSEAYENPFLKPPKRLKLSQI